MARPTLTDIQHQQQAWDATINTNNETLTEAPLPLVVYATPASLPAPNLFDQCLAMTVTPLTLWTSNGTTWEPVSGGGTSGSTARIVSVETELSIAPAASVATWVGAFPAGVTQIGVTGRVKTLFQSGAGTDLDIGDGTDVDRYKAALGFGAGSDFTPADATADPGGWSAAAEDVVITMNGGTDLTGTGVLRLVATYIELTAPTS